MNKNLSTVLLLALAIDVVFAFLVALGPRTPAAQLHHSYVVPGPFFDAKRIVDSYSLDISWKSAGQWSESLSPAKENFIAFSRYFNPSSIYRSRYERALYQVLIVKPDSTVNGLQNDVRFRQLTRYLTTKYGFSKADSIRIRIVRKRAVDFQVAIDTLYNVAEKGE